ncbi:MAG: hypothetical protein FJW38_18180 [Acidobacteria bacterium]|nr:hypothetical protein [Acidobacteriota bacterium]
MMRALPLVFLLFIGCEKKADPTRAVETPKPTKITHFYGNAVSLPRGETLTLCYGTENAATVSITPPIETELRPSLNRCIGDTPAKDTTYTLKAGGPGGDVSQTFQVKIGPPPKPLITNFQLQGDFVRPRGSKVQFCYAVDFAAAVSLSPPAAQPLKAGTHCFEVVVEKTTTYILTATAPDGTVDRVQNTVTLQ